ncbi:hypothetical protein EG68_09130 [Paragonimus skrjabini miyazakii]|uniref:DUF4590 domain-containing protein n=1 Tax=Paragonimus skrjabini miyazakii TaxID=59628 RepID=A0A8S9Y8D1_9TREM|nr:hypothetical protein EG68_09130 [Paragonimus skrjabini miyazakii]
MDKRSQIEVAKLRRIYRMQQLKERKAGKPPYLYLNEPGMPKRRVKNKTRMRTRKRSGQRGLNSYTRHSKSHDETMAPTAVPELQLNYPPERTETASRPRLKQKCHEGRGDRILVGEQQILHSGWKSITDIHSANHSSQSESLGQLGSPIHSGHSPAQALPEPDGTAKNLLLTGSQPLDNCIGQSRSQAYHMHRLSSCPASELRNTMSIPALVLSTKTAPHGVILTGHYDSRLGIARSKSLLFRRPPLPVRSSATGAYTCQDETAVCQCIDQVEKVDIGEEKPVQSHPGDEPEEVVTSHSLPPITEQNKPQSPCVVRFIYLGASRLEESTLGHGVSEMNQQTPRTGRTQTMDSDQRQKRWVTVVQQPSGASTVTVFKGLLQPGDAFEFTSRRTYGFPFSLSLYIDGTQDSRISACCEYRHKRGVRIGGKHGHFVYSHVEGSIPCFKCQAARSVREEKRRKRKQAVRQAESGATGTKNDEQTATFSVESAGGTVDNVFGTNLNRRLVKSTHWEHVTPTMNNLQSCASEENLDGQYDTEQVEGSEESQRLCPANDSFISETENTQSRSYAKESEAPEDENDYQENEYTEEDEDEEFVEEMENENEQGNEKVGCEEEGSLNAAGSACERPDQLSDVDETSEVLFTSNKDCKVIVEKVDAFYQRRMSTKCPVQTEQHKNESQRNEMFSQGHPVQTSRLAESHFAGDVIESLTGCDLYVTDVAEETPLHEYSIAETMGSGSSCASGDRMQPEAFKYASSIIVQSSPSNVHTRVPSVLVESEDEYFQASTLTSKAEMHVSTERIRTQSTEVNFLNESATKASDILPHDADLVVLPVSPRSSSCMTVSRSVTFTSSMSQSKSPTQPLDENDIDLKTNMLPLRITDSTTFRLTTETNDLFHIRASPQCIKEQIGTISVSPSSLNQLDCRSELLFQNLSLDKHESNNGIPLLKKPTPNVHMKCMSPLFGSSLNTLLPRKGSGKLEVLFDRSGGAETSRTSETITDFYTPEQSPAPDAYETASETTLLSPFPMAYCVEQKDSESADASEEDNASNENLTKTSIQSPELIHSASASSSESIPSQYSKTTSLPLPTQSVTSVVQSSKGTFS